MSDVAFKVVPGKVGNPPMGFASLDTASSDVTIEWTSATSFRIVVTNLPPVELLSFKDPGTGAPVPNTYIQGYLVKGIAPELQLGVGVVTFTLTEVGITAIGNVSVLGTVSASHFNISSAIYAGAINISVTGNINNWSPTDWANRAMIRVTPSAAWTITGAVAVNSSRRTIFNVSSSNTLTLAHQSTSSIAANRFVCPGNTDYVIQPNAAVDIWYDTVSQRWRVIG